MRYEARKSVETTSADIWQARCAATLPERINEKPANSRTALVPFKQALMCGRYEIKPGITLFEENPQATSRAPSLCQSTNRNHFPLRKEYRPSQSARRYQKQPFARSDRFRLLQITHADPESLSARAKSFVELFSRVRPLQDYYQIRHELLMSAWRETSQGETPAPRKFILPFLIYPFLRLLP